MAAGNIEFALYYSVMFGKICRQFKEPTANTKTRRNKNGKQVHEEFYDYLSGTITDITTKDSEFGRAWLITLMDGMEKQILQLNYSSGYSNAFLKTLPNVDLDSRVTLIPKETIEDGGKKKTTMFITQHGKAVKWYYTADDKNGLPDLIIKEGKGKDRGKKIYDDSEVMEFLEQMVENDIKPNLPKIDSEVPEEVKEEKQNLNGGWKPIEEVFPDEDKNYKGESKSKDSKKSVKQPVKKSAKPAASGKKPDRKKPF